MPETAGKHSGHDDRPVLVVGMHRSGTSCLAGCLEAAGLHLGEVNTQAPHNQRGNRENLAVMQLHDALLDRHGAAWDRPPASPVVWTDADLDALSDATATAAAHTPWGGKDPRSLMLMEGWLKRFSPRFVGTYRHPEAVIASLCTRAEAWGQPMDPDAALDLWAAYNHALCALRRQHDFPIVRYDIDGGLYVEKVTAIARDLGLPHPEAAGQFFDRALKHQAASRPVPERVEAIWQELERHAV